MGKKRKKKNYKEQTGFSKFFSIKKLLPTTSLLNLRGEQDSPSKGWLGYFTNDSADEPWFSGWFGDDDEQNDGQNEGSDEKKSSKKEKSKTKKKRKERRVKREQSSPSESEDNLSSFNGSNDSDLASGGRPGGIDSECNEKDEDEAEFEGNEDTPDLDDEVDLEEMDFDTFWKNLWQVNVDSGDNEKEKRQDPRIAELVESDPKAESVPGEESWLHRLWEKFFAKNSDAPSETINAQPKETNTSSPATTGTPAVPAVPVSAERSFLSDRVVYPGELEPGLLVEDESIRRTEKIREWLKRYASVHRDITTHSEEFQQQILPARAPCGAVRALRDVTLTCYRTPLPSSFTDDHAREIRMCHNGRMHDGSLRRS
ncbi:hypothetical protein FOZ61_005088 [Perkinsus olseni]|uniref:Uncharacterized protein n=1 Tax=Perkinsus olseni TaxID=32597 RepID=A0A7J6LJD1_PEROL|nr:hypothetical protein FOL46_008091 [Perkinsus olseni]KAF4659001.1 hypothetical protein FOZ61_005088 [Perkinsus olseni]